MSENTTELELDEKTAKHARQCLRLGQKQAAGSDDGISRDEYGPLMARIATAENGAVDVTARDIEILWNGIAIYDERLRESRSTKSKTNQELADSVVDAGFDLE